MALKYQTTIEYLLKMYITMVVERTFGVINVRGVLLHVKTLLYDLEFLNITSGEVYTAIERVITWRSHWFEKPPGRKELLIWHAEFFKLLGGLLREKLEETRLYLPESAIHNMVHDIALLRSDNFGYKHKGVALSSIVGGLTKKLFNIQYRFNRFDFYVPLTDCEPCDVIALRHRFLAEVHAHHRERLPYFLLPGSSLAIFSQ